MKLRVMIRQVGTSDVVTIPKQIMDELNLMATNYVLIDIVNNKIIIEKDKNQK